MTVAVTFLLPRFQFWVDVLFQHFDPPVKIREIHWFSNLNDIFLSNSHKILS